MSSKIETSAARAERKARNRAAMDELYKLDQELGFDDLDDPVPPKSAFRGGDDRQVLRVGDVPDEILAAIEATEAPAEAEAVERDLATNRAVTIAPLDHELTPNQAPDLLAYKRRSDIETDKALDDLVAAEQELGLE